VCLLLLLVASYSGCAGAGSQQKQLQPQHEQRGQAADATSRAERRLLEVVWQQRRQQQLSITRKKRELMNILGRSRVAHGHKVSATPQDHLLLLANQPASLASLRSALGRIDDEDGHNDGGLPPLHTRGGLGQTGFDGTGDDLWSAALLMQHFLSDNRGARFVAGRRCIELGAGSGAVSIAVARMGAAQMVATDGEFAIRAMLH
jgi:hypothetical protein